MNQNSTTIKVTYKHTRINQNMIFFTKCRSDKLMLPKITEPASNPKSIGLMYFFTCEHATAKQTFWVVWRYIQTINRLCIFFGTDKFEIQHYHQLTGTARPARTLLSLKGCLLYTGDTLSHDTVQFISMIHMIKLCKTFIFCSYIRNYVGKGCASQFPLIFHINAHVFVPQQQD